MPPSPHPLAGRRVLVLEDEYLIAMDEKHWLQEAGAEVVGPAADEERALGLIEDGGVDAAVLDVNLGDGRTGYPVADRLSALGVPFVFATGDVAACGDPVHQARPRIAKPFRRTSLVTALAALFL